MKTVEQFTFPASTFGESKHDWPAILAAKVEHDALGKPGPAVLLTHGEDFTGDPDLFVGTIRNQAAKRHLRVKVKKVETPGTPAVNKEGNPILDKEGKPTFKGAKPTVLYVQTCNMNDEEKAESDARIEKAKEVSKARAAKKRAAAQVAGTVPASQAS